MLCCVSKKSASGTDYEFPLKYSRIPSLVASNDSSAPLTVDPNSARNANKFEAKIQLSEKDVPPILLPCAICARTFKPQSLEKHTRICERAAIKKRKPFDSAKQRIQGTELAEFLPKQEKKRCTIQEDRHCKPKASWKQTHNEFLRAIRAARGEVVEVPTQRQGPSVISKGAPTRANEKGMCPTCNRLFGIKAYDRHVAWCKERAIRLPISPATNIAKERLEARMKYRAPALKNRRLTNREKYSPGSAINLSLANKSSPPFITTKAKESASVPNCNKGGDSPVNPKTIVVSRRPGQNRDQPAISSTAKSRLTGQTNRPIEDCESGLSSTVQSSRPNFQQRSQLPVLPSKSVKPKIIPSASSRSKLHETKFDTISSISRHDRSNEQRLQISVSARSQTGNSISGKIYNNANPKVNGIGVNDDVIGMIVQPCNIHRRDREVVTWKQISDEKNCVERGEIVTNFIDRPGIERKTARRAGSIDECRIDEKIKISECRRRKSAVAFGREQSTNHDRSPTSLEIDDNITWAGNIEKLDRTYLIKESIGTDVDNADVVSVGKWKPVKNSPRMEYRSKNVAGDSNVPVIFNENYESYFSTLTDFNETVNLTSTPMPSDCDQFGERACNWSGGLKPEEPEILKLEFPGSAGVRGSVRDSTKLSEMASGKAMPMVKCISRPKPVSNDELILRESLNVRRRNEDYESPESSRSSCKRNDSIVESSGPKRKDRDALRSTRNEGRSEENPASKYLSHSFTSKFIDRPPVEVSGYSEDILDRSVRRSSESIMTVDVSNCNASQLYLNDTEEYKKKEKSQESIDARTNSRCRSYERSKRASDKQILVKNENSTYESSDKNSTRHPNLTEGNRVNVKVDEDQTTVKLDPISLTNDDSSRIDTANDSAKLEANARRRCGTYVIEKASASNAKHRVSDESIDDRPLEKRQKIENIESLDTNDNESDDGPPDNTVMSRSLPDTTNEPEIRQIHEKYVNNNFDYDSDNAVVDLPTKDPDTNSESYACKELIVVEEEEEELANDLRGKTLSEPYVKSKERKRQEIGSKSNRTSVTEMQRRIRRSMNILRGSTDTLISSVEAVRSHEKVASSCETEICTLEAIERPRSERLRIEFLPRIDGETTTTTTMKKNERRPKERQTCTKLYWDGGVKTSQNKLIVLDRSRKDFRLLKRNPKIQILPPMLSADSPSDQQSGTSNNYDPFLLAEHQMNELFSDTSEQSITDSPPTAIRSKSTSPFPLSHSSAFVKYPSPPSSASNKRASVIAPPSEFDDFISDFSSDSTETNSTSQEIFINDLNSQTRELDPLPRDSLARRVVIDKSKLLTGSGSNNNVSSNTAGQGKTFINCAKKARKILPEKVSPKIVVRSTINRSQSVRASSAPKAVPERKNSVNSAKRVNDNSRGFNATRKNNNDYAIGMSGSNLSLNSIVSSTEANIKRSNSAFDELISSFEDDGSSSTFPSLKSFLNNDSMSLSSPVQGNRQRNGQNSDEELSSPDSYKRQDHHHGKLSADSAYSSLNRKYSNHGRSANDVTSCLEEEASRRKETNATPSKYKMSKFCHECGSKFPETAKFCCECGVKRLAL